MIKFRTRLLFALITLIFAVLIGLGLLLGQLFKSYYSNEFNERLGNENNLLKTYIEETGGLSAFNHDKIRYLSELMDTRITLTNEKGNVLFDSGRLSGDVKNESHQRIVKNLITNQGNDKNHAESIEGYDLNYYWDPIKKAGDIEGYVVISTKMDVLKTAYSQIWWLLGVSFVFALIVIIILGASITSRYTKPIESATNVAIELAKGNYRARTYEEHIDETGLLSSSINILAKNLQDMMKAKEMQQDRLTTLIENMGNGLILIDKRGYISLINKAFKEIFQIRTSDYLFHLYYEVIEHQEISDLVEEIFITEQQLKRQIRLPLGIELRDFEVYGAPIIGTNDVWKGILLVFHDITEIKNLEQMRKDFVANVSHELKTPITSIKGFTETLLDGAKEDPKSLDLFLNIMLVESERMQTLIDELLELSKIEQNHFFINIEKVNLNELLGEVVTMLEKKALDKEIPIDFSMGEIDSEIEGDRFRLKQVFINVINNAIMYTPNNGKITVFLEETADKVLIKVIDTGIGIKKQEIPRIFERFYRIDKARSRDSGGTGLGLAIVKHLVEAHHGTITVTSEVGKGSVFTISLLKRMNPIGGDF